MATAKATPKSTPKTSQKSPADFEAAMRELEQLIAGMENGDLPLEASLRAYQRGAFLVKYCQSLAGRTGAAETRKAAYCGKTRKLFSIIVRGDVY